MPLKIGQQPMKIIRPMPLDYQRRRAGGLDQILGQTHKNGGQGLAAQFRGWQLQELGEFLVHPKQPERRQLRQGQGLFGQLKNRLKKLRRAVGNFPALLLPGRRRL